MDFSRMMISWVPFLAMMVMVCKCFGADSGGSDQTISQVLAQYGLPIGLLPDSVKSYYLGNDGSFQVELNGPCYVQFNYLVYYEKTVAGKLSYGKITDLEGIQAKQLFLWVSITGMEVDLPSADYIYFNVGFVSKKIEISWFESVHTCKNSLGNEPCKEIEVALTEEIDVQ